MSKQPKPVVDTGLDFIDPGGTIFVEGAERWLREIVSDAEQVLGGEIVPAVLHALSHGEIAAKTSKPHVQEIAKRALFGATRALEAMAHGERFPHEATGYAMYAARWHARLYLVPAETNALRGKGSHEGAKKKRGGREGSLPSLIRAVSEWDAKGAVPRVTAEVRKTAAVKKLHWANVTSEEVRKEIERQKEADEAERIKEARRREVASRRKERFSYSRPKSEGTADQQKAGQ